MCVTNVCFFFSFVLFRVSVSIYRNIQLARKGLDEESLLVRKCINIGCKDPKTWILVKILNDQVPLNAYQGHDDA